jgi:hypothetical protein
MFDNRAKENKLVYTMEISAAHKYIPTLSSKQVMAAKAAVSVVVMVGAAALAKMVGLHAGAAVGMGLLSGGTIFVLSSINYHSLKEGLTSKRLSEKELMALEDAKQFGSEDYVVKPIGFSGDLSEQREKSLEKLSRELTSASKWATRPAKDAYEEYLNLTIAQARAVIAEVQSRHTTVEEQAKFFAEGEGNCFAIFHAVRDAYDMAAEGRICNDPSKGNLRESWEAGALAVEPAWREQYNQFCDEIEPLMAAYPEDRVRNLMTKQ